LFNTEDEERTNIFYTPVYAYNLYNKSMIGAAFYNSIFPQKRNEFVFMPVYAFNTKDINGYFNYWHNFYPGNKINRISIGFTSARFASEGLITASKVQDNAAIINKFGSMVSNITYEKFAPFIAINFHPKNIRSQILQQLQARYVLINEQEVNYGYLSNLNAHYGIAEINYNYSNPFILYPSSFNINYQQGINNSIISRLGISFTQSILYKNNKKKAEIRFFGGSFFNQANPNGNTKTGNNYERAMFQAAGVTGTNDYLYDYTMIGRAENNQQQNVWARQVILRDAGFRNFINIGSTDKLIMAANITIPLPIGLPVGIYADASYANLKSLTTNNIVN